MESIKDHILTNRNHSLTDRSREGGRPYLILTGKKLRISYASAQYKSGAFP